MSERASEQTMCTSRCLLRERDLPHIRSNEKGWSRALILLVIRNEISACILFLHTVRIELCLASVGVGKATASNK